MKQIRLRGWNAGVEKKVEADGEDVWHLVFEEKMPPTGDQIVFSMNRQTRDEIVRQLTGGVVLAGGELPRI